MFDYTKVKLGKQTAHHDSRVPMLSKYTASLPPAPAATSYDSKITNLGMMLNNTLGDCTCAAVGHVIQQWTAEAQKKQVIIPDPDILKLYEVVGHYNPDNPKTDRGAIEINVLNYWLANPFVGNKLSAFCALEPQNLQDIKDAVYIFGNCYIGLQMPLSAQGQTVWTLPPGGATGKGAPGSWGGHAVPIVAYDARGLTCITWGELIRMTWQFWNAYCDEAYGLLSPDWIAAGKAPSGFDSQQLITDMGELKAAFPKGHSIAA
ncbi:MAG: hypothetical protein ABSG07_08845 [Terriglobales bacterium]|jgi:hypothetical protein